jgi:exodeoxyribonuclease VII large subunit
LFRIAAHRRHLHQLRARLRNLGPDATLARGFALVSFEGRLVKAASQLGPGDAVSIRLAKGQVEAAVKQALETFAQEEARAF